MQVRGVYAEKNVGFTAKPRVRARRSKASRRDMEDRGWGRSQRGEICGGSCEVRWELPMRGREKGDKDRLVLVLGKQREIGKNGATSKEGGSVLAQLK